MENNIDQLSKDLAGGMSRRRAFSRFFAGLAALVLGGKRAFGQKGKGNNVCVDLCRHQGLSGSDFGRCVSESAKCPEGQCAFSTNGGAFICYPV